jgi:hypothetical protein
MRQSNLALHEQSREADRLERRLRLQQIVSTEVNDALRDINESESHTNLPSPPKPNLSPSILSTVSSGTMTPSKLSADVGS